MVRQSALERRLPRRVLALAGRHDVAHDAFVHDFGIDAGTPDRFANGHRAELRRSEAFQDAEELAGWRSDRADDHRLTHMRNTEILIADYC